MIELGTFNQRQYSSGFVSADHHVVFGYLTREAGRDLQSGARTVASLVAADFVAGVLWSGTTEKLFINGVEVASTTYPDTGYGALQDSVPWSWRNPGLKMYTFSVTFPDGSPVASVDEAQGRSVYCKVNYGFQQSDSRYTPPSEAEAELYSITWPLKLAAVFHFDSYTDNIDQEGDAKYSEGSKNAKNFWTGLVNCSVFSDYSEYHPLSVAIFDAMDVQESDQAKAVIDDLVTGLNDAGYFARMDRLYVSRGVHTEQAGMLNWTDPSISATKHGSASWTQADGFCGSTVVGSYINTHFTPATDGVNYTQNSGSIGVYVSARPTGKNGAYFGRTGGTANQAIYLTDDVNTGELGGKINSSAGGGAVGAAATGLIVLSRTASNVWRIDVNGVTVHTGTNASGGLSTSPIYLCAQREESGDFVGKECNVKEAAWWAGGNFTLAEQGEIRALLETYFTAMAAL